MYSSQIEFSSRSLESASWSGLSAKDTLSSFVRSSQTERNVLNSCNERLSSYIERVRELEAENGLLLSEKAQVESRWGTLSISTQETLENDLDLLREKIENNETLRDNFNCNLSRALYEQGEFEFRNDELRSLIENMRNEKIQLNQEISNKSETLKNLEMNIDRERGEISKYQSQRDLTWSNITDLYNTFNFERAKRISIEHASNTLREKIDFLKQVFEKEELEMSQLGECIPLNDQLEFYKEHLRRIIKDIRSDYESLAEEQARIFRDYMRSLIVQQQNQLKDRSGSSLEIDLQASNVDMLKSSLSSGEKELSALKSDIKTLLKRLADLEEHAEQERIRIGELIAQQESERTSLIELINQLNNDCSQLHTNKAVLDYELQVYKRLIDSELSRVRIAQTVEHEYDSAHATLAPVVTSGTLNGKIKNRKEIRGDVGIDDVAPNGSYICIRNYSPSDSISLNGWKLNKTVDSSKGPSYSLGSDSLLHADSSIKIWSNGFSSEKQDGDLVFKNIETWGIGLNSITVLINQQDEVKSTYSQEMSFDN